MKYINASIAAAILLATSVTWAQANPPVAKVESQWARATVQGQKGTGAFMKITAPEGGKLVGASSPVAGVTEVHEMKMEGDVMKMRAITALDLPAGQQVELKPGGYHVMLLDLKTPLKPGTQVPLTLMLQDAQGKPSKVELSLPVATSAPGGTPASGHGAHHKH